MLEKDKEKKSSILINIAVFLSPMSSIIVFPFRKKIGED